MTNRVSRYFIKVPVFLALLFIITNCVQKDRNISSANPTDVAESPAAVKPNFTYSEIDPVEAYNRETTFEKCYDNTKNYLHFDILDQVPRAYLVRHERDWSKKIPIKCIQYAQQKYRGKFARCEFESDKYTYVGRPCLNETYTNLVYNAYHDVSECFNVDPKKAYLQIFIESGFHVNAIAPGKDAGIGQFTANGIQRVGHSLINRVERILSESNSPSCARIANIMGKLQPDDFKKENRCVMIAIPQNPYRSLVMHHLHGLLDKIYFTDDFLEARPELKGIMTDEIIGQLSMLAYNRGIQGTLRLIDGYVNYRKGSKQPLVTDDFNLWQNLNSALRIMKKNEGYRKYLISVINHGVAQKVFVKMSFAEYLAVQEKPYMALMADAKDLVDGRFGPGTCYE